MLSWAAIHLSPFVAFFGGVGISNALKLNGSLSPKQAWLVSIPVGLFTVGTLLGVTMYNTTNISGTVTVSYGYFQNVPRFLTFIGTVMFYGTMPAQLFDKIRTHVVK